MTTSPGRVRRGYALGIVLLVSVVLAGAVLAMLNQLAAASKLAGRSVGQRRAQYLCEGVGSVADFLMEEAAAREEALSRRTQTDQGAISIDLEPLRRGVAADGIEIEELTAQPTGESRISVVAAGPLAGLETSVVDLELRVALKGQNSPPCQARMSQPLASVSLFQFPAMSVGTVSVSPTASRRMDLPRRGGIAWGQTAADPGGVHRLFRATGENAPLTLPLSSTTRPSGPRGLGGGQQNSDLRFLVSLPGSTGHVAKADVYAYAADLRIIDGEWYFRAENDPLAWPGLPLWSDHPCTDDDRVGVCSNAVASSSRKWRDGPSSLLRRRLYSRYERNGRGFLDAVEGNGVISYGALSDTLAPATFLSPEVCDPPPAGFSSTTACAHFTAPPDRADKGGPAAALLDAARGGFVDPGIGPILPINLDVALLGCALNERRHGELGESLCL